MGEEEMAEDNNNNDSTNMKDAVATEREEASRKERRKAAKKEKRKKKRKEVAEMARREEEARLNDPEEQLRIQTEEEQERARVERERMEFEERERKILEEWERRRAEEEEKRRRRDQEDEYKLNQNNQAGYTNEADEDGWEYVEEGPPEIIWQGNEIIVKKKKIRVKKKDADQRITKEDPSRPTSNPLPPQSEVFADHKNTPVLSAQQLLENVAHETPNFGTEQDKAHCPFHLKTGACRFGSRCSRIHFYPDKSCTLLIKNMYNGPGLAWEQDEGLEHTDEEVEHAYEEFYEDVHTEFLKFGEIVNFKVCRNGSSHLRGNVYVHYKSLDSAVLAYQSINGRYFAGKQIQCEFVGVTRWKVAICGEFMKSKLQACSRGMACNFIHCFRNPGGDYEWADWDKPAPKYWLKKMAALFGYPDDSGYGREIERGSPRLFSKSTRTSTDDVDRYHYRRSQSREIGYSRNSRNYSEDDSRRSERRRCRTTADRKHPRFIDDKQSQGGKCNRMSIHEIDSDENMHHSDKDNYRHRHSSRSRRQREASTSPDDDHDWTDDGKRNSSHIHTEQSSRSDCSDEFEDKTSTGQHGHESKHSSIRDHSGQCYRSDSSSRSKKDTGETGRFESEREFRDHIKKSKRKRDNGEKYVSESRGEPHRVKRSHATNDYRIDEASDDRGRWEPDLSDSAEFDS